MKKEPQLLNTVTFPNTSHQTLSQLGLKVSEARRTMVMKMLTTRMKDSIKDEEAD